MDHKDARFWLCWKLPGKWGKTMDGDYNTFNGIMAENITLRKNNITERDVGPQKFIQRDNVPRLKNAKGFEIYQKRPKGAHA